MELGVDAHQSSDFVGRIAWLLLLVGREKRRRARDDNWRRPTTGIATAFTTNHRHCGRLDAGHEIN